MKSTHQTVTKISRSPPVAIETLVVLLLTIACSGSELRGKSVSSADGKTYLVVDDDNCGACGQIKVDGVNWPHPIHASGPIAPGIHKIQRGENGSGIEFKLKSGQIRHFNYWGP